MSPRNDASCCWNCGASYVDRQDGVDSVMCDPCRREASDELEAELDGLGLIAPEVKP